MILRMMRDAAKKHGFRQCGPIEDLAQYRDALVKHVDERDWTEAHELRVGRPQKEWTQEDAAALRRHIEGLPFAPQEFAEGLHVFRVARVKSPYEVTNAGVRELADGAMRAVMARREEAPQTEMPIIVNVLLTTGELLATIARRSERVAIVKWLARTEPVFAYIVIFDAYMHHVDLQPAVDQRATKLDAIAMHVGSRDGLRIVRLRPYRYDKGRVVFIEPTPDDMTGTDNAQDPYASIFAMPMASDKVS